MEQHATPYDPKTDRYNTPPFDQPITTTKATAIYNMHTYWSKKPHDAIRQYIRHYTKPGDIVLDPFCGSGGTALAALMEGRAAIAIDLSPAATFITRFAQFRWAARYDPAWLARDRDYTEQFLESGIHRVPGLFTGAYFAHPDEIVPLMESAGLSTVRVLGCKGAVSHIEEGIDQLEGDDWEYWVQLNHRLGQDLTGFMKRLRIPALWIKE